MNKYREHSIQISEDTSPTDQEGALHIRSSSGADREGDRCSFFEIRRGSRGHISSVASLILL